MDGQLSCHFTLTTPSPGRTTIHAALINLFLLPHYLYVFTSHLYILEEQHCRALLLISRITAAGAGSFRP